MDCSYVREGLIPKKKYTLMYLGIGVERERDKVNVVDVNAGG